MFQDNETNSLQQFVYDYKTTFINNNLRTTHILSSHL